MDRISPYSIGLCPLLGPLPCYPLRLCNIKETAQGNHRPHDAFWRLVEWCHSLRQKFNFDAISKRRGHTSVLYFANLAPNHSRNSPSCLILTQNSPIFCKSAIFVDRQSSEAGGTRINGLLWHAVHHKWWPWINRKMGLVWYAVHSGYASIWNGGKQNDKTSVKMTWYGVI